MFSDQDDAPRLGQPVHDRRGYSPENLRDCAEGRRRRRQQDRGRTRRQRRQEEEKVGGRRSRLRSSHADARQRCKLWF